MANYRTAMGKSVDMSALAAKNEKTRAVGNMKVNARGDTIDSHGKIIKPVTAKVNDQYAHTVGNKLANMVKKPGTPTPTSKPQAPAPEPAPKIDLAELTQAEKDLEAEFDDDELTEQIKKMEMEQLNKGKK